MKYYTLKKILKHNAKYNVIFGERSNGKTFAVQQLAIARYLSDGSQLAVVRRWQDDYTGKRGAAMFDGVVSAGIISKLSGGKWSGVYYHASRWYLCRIDENGERETDTKPFAFGFAITAQEHDKSTSYPEIRTILFDEFLTRTGYLPDEFVLFCNVLSTIIRDRDDVQIFMLGNTVNKYCPYFSEMGLTRVNEMKQGEIDVYKYGDSGLTVAVEYAEPAKLLAGKRGKPSDVYFAFNNPKLKMITGGEWELAIYPHCPEKYRPCDVIFTYFIQFDKQLLQCEIVAGESGYFTFIHRKTTPIKNDDDWIFSPSANSPNPCIRRSIKKPEDKLGERILYFFSTNRVFYQSNDIGDAVKNYFDSV